MKQTEEKYKKIMLGFGVGSIYDYGCYLTALVHGMQEKGWAYTPESFNELLKSKNLFIGEYNNYIDVDNLFKKLPDMFEFYQRVNAFNAMVLQNSLEDGFVVLGQVDARGISGSGSHFVRITKYENGLASIYDPWFGDIQPVTKRYAKYGNILGFRIFHVLKPKDAPSVPPAPINTPVTKSWTLEELTKDIPTEIEEAFDYKDYKSYDKKQGLGQFKTLLENYELSITENDSLIKKFEQLEKENKELLADTLKQLNDTKVLYRAQLDKTGIELIIEGLSKLIKK